MRSWFHMQVAQLQCTAYRKVFFEDLLSKAKERQAKEEKRAKLIAEDFTDLLRSRHVKHDSTWEDVKSQIDHKERFKAVRQVALFGLDTIWICRTMMQTFRSGSKSCTLSTQAVNATSHLLPLIFDPWNPSLHLIVQLNILTKKISKRKSKWSPTKRLGTSSRRQKSSNVHCSFIHFIACKSGRLSIHSPNILSF